MKAFAAWLPRHNPEKQPQGGFRQLRQLRQLHQLCHWHDYDHSYPHRDHYQFEAKLSFWQGMLFDLIYDVLEHWPGLVYNFVYNCMLCSDTSIGWYESWCTSQCW